MPLQCNSIEMTFLRQDTDNRFRAKLCGSLLPEPGNWKKTTDDKNKISTWKFIYKNFMAMNALRQIMR